MLRGQYANENEMLSKYSEIISDAIKKHPIRHNVVCYRGSDIDMTGGAKEGEGFRSKQFISTSVIRSRKFHGRYEFVIYVPEGAYAAYIEKISAYPKQRELLIDKDTTFTVLSRKENVIELEVLLI